MKIISLMLTICFLCSFTLPTKKEFTKMTECERTQVIKETWKNRYDIMIKSESGRDGCTSRGVGHPGGYVHRRSERATAATAAAAASDFIEADGRHIETISLVAAHLAPMGRGLGYESTVLKAVNPSEGE